MRIESIAGAPDEGALSFNRPLTIDEVTVKLEHLEVDSGVLEVKFSSYTTPSDISAEDFGLHAVTFSNGDVLHLHAGRTLANIEGGGGVSYFLLRRQYPGINDVIAVNLGLYLVSRPNLFGSAKIDLPSNFAESIEGRSETISLNGEFLANYQDSSGAKQSLPYHVPSLTITQSHFYLTLQPASAEAELMSLATVGKDKVVLKDDTGRQYKFSSASADWRHQQVSDYRVSRLDFMRLYFDELPSPSAKRFDLLLEGGAEVVGPFVFEDIQALGGTVPTSTAAPTAPPDMPQILDPWVNRAGNVVVGWRLTKEPTITGYRILRRVPAKGEETLRVYVKNTGSGKGGYFDTKVTPGVEHIYSVSAINSFEVSEPSETVSVTP